MVISETFKPKGMFGPRGDASMKSGFFACPKVFFFQRRVSAWPEHTFRFKSLGYNHAQSTDLEISIFLGTRNFLQLQTHEKLCLSERKTKVVFLEGFSKSE